MSFDGIIAHHLWNETPFDPIGASAFRRKVEPWLSAIFQTEHLSLYWNPQVRKIMHELYGRWRVGLLG
jgi:hypothetical protein